MKQSKNNKINKILAKMPTVYSICLIIIALLVSIALFATDLGSISFEQKIDLIFVFVSGSFVANILFFAILLLPKKDGGK